MSLYHEMARHKAVKNYKGEFGVEIETEALKAYEMPKMAFWNGHKDDSLRGPAPYEYVLRQPLMFQQEIPAALQEFKQKMEGVKFDDKSFTTSVHTHVNMLNEKYVTIGNFLVIYCIAENLLKKFAGPSRESNLFCLPMCDAEENFQNLIYVLDCINKKRWAHLELDQGANKYAALNLTALWKYGSLEIRLLRGTTDTQVIHDWIGMQYAMLEFARQDITPKDIISSWRKKGSELLSDIFGQYRKMLRFQNEDRLIEQNFWYAANAAMSINDWRALDNVPQPKKLQSKNLDELAMKIYGSTFDELAEEKKAIIIKNFRYLDDEVIENFAQQVNNPNAGLVMKKMGGAKKLAPFAQAAQQVAENPFWNNPNDLAAAEQPQVFFDDDLPEGN